MEKECYAIVAVLLQWHVWMGKKPVGVGTDNRSLEGLAKKDLKTLEGASPRQALWHELFSRFYLHVVYSPGPEGDFSFGVPC